MKNNYNMSSTGINIEAHAFYDTWLAQDYYTKSMQSLKNNSRYISDQWFIDCGNFPSYDQLEWRVKGDEPALREWIKASIPDHGDQLDIDTATGGELRDIIQEEIAQSYRLSLEYIADIERDFKVELAPFYKNEQITVLSMRVTGYSQGDACEVFYSPDLMQSIWGNVPSDNDLRDQFTNLLFDQPISASVTINGEDFPYELDQYEFKRDEWINSIMTSQAVKDLDQDLLRKELEKTIPKEPDYN